MGYLRFEMRRTAEGLFSVLDRLRCDDAVIRRRWRREVAELRDWLFVRTPAAPEWAYRRARWPSEPRTWWLESATEHVERAWRVCLILNNSRIPLRPVRSGRCPGVEVWRDEVQAVIAARPEAVRKLVRAPKRGEPRGAGWDAERATIRRWDWSDPPGRLPAGFTVGR